MSDKIDEIMSIPSKPRAKWIYVVLQQLTINAFTIVHVNSFFVVNLYIDIIFTLHGDYRIFT